MRTTEESIRFTVATLSIRRHDWAEEQHGSWDDALTALSIWNSLHDPDIFCVQQLPTNLFKRFAAVLSMRRAGEPRSRMEGLDDGCLVLWNPIHLGLKAGRTFWFSHSPSLPGSRLPQMPEPRSGQVVSLQNDLFGLRVVSCHWEPNLVSDDEEALSDKARTWAGGLILNLLDKGIEHEPELTEFSDESRGMPSLICGGFEERPGRRHGRRLLEEATFRPAINMDDAVDEIYVSPGIRIVEVLDNGGPNGQRPMLVELEVRLNQDDGVESERGPLPANEEQNSWPEIPGLERLEAGSPEPFETVIK